MADDRASYNILVDWVNPYRLVDETCGYVGALEELIFLSLNLHPAGDSQCEIVRDYMQSALPSFEGIREILQTSDRDDSYLRLSVVKSFVDLGDDYRKFHVHLLAIWYYVSLRKQGRTPTEWLCICTDEEHRIKCAQILQTLVGREEVRREHAELYPIRILLTFRTNGWPEELATREMSAALDGVWGWTRERFVSPECSEKCLHGKIIKSWGRVWFEECSEEMRGDKIITMFQLLFRLWGNPNEFACLKPRALHYNDVVIIVANTLKYYNAVEYTPLLRAFSPYIAGLLILFQPFDR